MLTEGHPTEASFRFQEEEPLLDSPAVVEHVSRRHKVVQHLRARLTGTTWLAVYGQVGVGKTHVVTLLTEAPGRCDAWVRLRDVAEDLAVRRLNAALTSLARKSADRAGRPEEIVARSLGPGGVVVLDDIPRFGSGSLFWERLVTLTKAFSSARVSLITTSNYPIPTGIRELVTHFLAEEECPLFDEAEVADVLRSLGATGPVLSGNTVSFLTVVSRGHPVLVSATGRYLRQHQWQVDEGVLANLLLGAHAVDVGQEMLQRFIENVEDPDGRELLYRLKLVTGAFSDAQVLAVAAVSRQVERPHERLVPLLGSWVQRESHERYVLSPLLTAAPRRDLLPETERGCHFALAEALRDRTSISFHDFNSMVLHYAAAREYGKALSMLAHGLYQLLPAPPDVWDGGLIDLWANSAFPGAEAVEFRVQIRAMQVAVRLARGKMINWLIEDMEALLDECGPGSWAHIAIAANVSVALFRFQPRRSIKYMQTGLSILGTVVMPDGNTMQADGVAHLEKLPLLLGSEVRSAEHLKLWLGAFSTLEEGHRSRLLEEPGFADVITVMVDRLWRHEADKPQSEQAWEPLDVALSDAADVGSRSGAIALWIAAIRARTVVLGEHMDRLDDAVRLGDSGMSQVSTSYTRFMLNEAVGRQLLYAKRFAQARPYLEKATNEQGFEDHPLMTLALQNASWAVGQDSPESATDYSDRAVRLIKTIPANQHAEVLKATGEQVVAHWLAGHREQAFSCLGDGATLLCDHDEQSAEWRRVGLLFGLGRMWRIINVFEGIRQGFCKKRCYKKDEQSRYVYENKQISDKMPGKKSGIYV